MTPITEQQFDSYSVARVLPKAAQAWDEVEWYEHNERIAVINHDHADRDYAYVILSKASNGQYTYTDGKTGIATIEQARLELNQAF